MGKLKSIKSKMLWARVFKLAFYGIGFPMLLWFLREEKIALGTGYIIGDSGNMILYFGIAIWAVVWLAQLIAHAFKNRKARALLVTIVTLAVTVGPLVFCDLYVEKQIEALQGKYGQDKIASYPNQVVHFHEYAQELNAPLDEFFATYNIDYGYGNKAGKNTDGTETFDKPDEGGVFSQNGLYADGFIFGYDAAKKVILTYYDCRKAFYENPQNKTKDIDEELNKQLAALKSNSNSDWNKYRKTAEYQAAYGPDGTATKYYVTEERLAQIVSELGKALGSMDALNTILTAVQTILGLVDVDLSALNFDDIKAHLNGDLTVDYLLSVIQGVAPKLNLTKDSLMDLLESYSFYQSPTTTPIFDFLEDKNMRDYAWAKYEGMTHGGKVGSILLPKITKDDAGEHIGKVGCITLDKSGSDPWSENQLRDLFDRVERNQDYMAKLYPLISIRNMLILYSGFCVFGVAASYFFARLEQNQMKRLIEAASEGGIR